jgi:hypothetical protein
MSNKIHCKQNNTRGRKNKQDLLWFVKQAHVLSEMGAESQPVVLHKIHEE